jgi:hypothetical protein
MTTAQIATLDFTRPCPICDHHMDLSEIESVQWAPRTAGERLVFRCEKCGMIQSEWNAIPLVPASDPEIGTSE